MNKDLTIKEITQLVMDQAEAKGFGTTPETVNVPEKIALIQTEVSEAFEAYRHKNIDGKDGFKEELGDAVQRILHLCGALGIDIQEAILKKVESNKDRVWNREAMNEVSGPNMTASH